MASWADSPKPEDTDAMAYAEAWENRIDSDDRDDATDAERDAGTFFLPDVEYADEDETGQLGLGVPGEQRAITGLAPRHNCETGGHVWSRIGSSVGLCIWCREIKPGSHRDRL